jgi:ABC-type transport system involved in cytochrome bd biosynthesis fused ATPase/permease subunit
MNSSVLKSFFLWCTIINGVMLLAASLMLVCASGWVYQIHSALFGISREAFDIMIYCFIALYKMFWIMFNVVPYVALVIAGRKK